MTSEQSFLPSQCPQLFRPLPQPPGRLSAVALAVWSSAASLASACCGSRYTARSHCARSAASCRTFGSCSTAWTISSAVPPPPQAVATRRIPKRRQQRRGWCLQLQLAHTPQRPNTSPVLLLDEFAALGWLEPVLQAAGPMVGLGLQLWPILQDLARLRAAYGQTAATFLATAGPIQVSAPVDLDTTQWLSRALGRSTVAFETTSSSEGHGSSSHSSSTELTGRPRHTPDEAMRLHPDRQVLLRLGQRPTFTAKLRHY